MIWNWQQQDWPSFKYNKAQLEELEARFLLYSGMLIGAYNHLTHDDQTVLKIELISDEAINTADIEGEYLNRDSMQSSIRRNFGLETDNRKIPLAEQGMAEMMVDVYKSFAQPLTHETLFKWHTMLMRGRGDLQAGRYRTHLEPMQIVSGTIYNPKVHFEAPPSKDVKREMTQFIEWFNTSSQHLPYLTRAGIAHLYFECIHPFEDGNGRIGRSVAEKVLSQSIGQPTLISLSRTIQANKKDYYAMLEQHDKTLNITDWLIYFGKTIVTAQEYTQSLVNFMIKKAKFYDRAKGKLNPRQDKVIARMFEEGLRGFKGGLSAENYIRITDSSRATATRDLQDLVEKDLFASTGELKSTRYNLNI